MKSVLRFATSLALAAFLVSPPVASAYGDGTPDEAPPAGEAVCDAAGYSGAALGLCVAFCEANDCDVHPNGAACQRLRANHVKITGELAFPCELESPVGDDGPR